jgi:hypothetical protein
MAGTLKIFTIVLLAAVLAAPTAEASQCVSPKALSGRYKSNDGGTYFVKKNGNSVWWVGESPDGGGSWTNVFSGTYENGTFTGRWADVRGNDGKGTMTLRLIGAIETGVHGFERIDASGSGFGGVRWSRPCPSS